MIRGDLGLARAVREAARPLTGALDDYSPLLDLVGNRRLVLIGEASHGTHEFYRERAVLTKLLIAEKGFSAVAVEADWPEAYRVAIALARPPGFFFGIEAPAVIRADTGPRGRPDRSPVRRQTASPARATALPGRFHV